MAGLGNNSHVQPWSLQDVPPMLSISDTRAAPFQYITRCGWKSYQQHNEQRLCDFFLDCSEENLYEEFREIVVNKDEKFLF